MSVKNAAFRGAPTVLASLHGAQVYQSTYVSGMSLRRHGHDKAHLCFVLSGAYGEEVDGGEYERTPGTLIWYPAGAFHAERHYVTGHHLLVEIEPHWDELHRFRRPPGRVLAWHSPAQAASPEGRSLNALSRRLHAAAIAPGYSQVLVVESALLQLYAAILGMSGMRRTRRIGRTMHAGAASQVHAWPDVIREILHQQFRQKLFLSDLAVAAGVHPAHLTRGFREQFGCSIGNYVRRLRVLFAVERITESDESLPQIAASAGFADQCHLTRALREHLGQTPASLRRSRTLISPAYRRITDPRGRPESA